MIRSVEFSTVACQGKYSNTTGEDEYFPCKEFSAKRIGETGSNPAKRLMQHKGDVKRCQKKNGIVTHAWNNNYMVN